MWLVRYLKYTLSKKDLCLCESGPFIDCAMCPDCVAIGSADHRSSKQAGISIILTTVSASWEQIFLTNSRRVRIMVIPPRKLVQHVAHAAHEFVHTKIVPKELVYGTVLGIFCKSFHYSFMYTPYTKYPLYVFPHHPPHASSSSWRRVQISCSSSENINFRRLTPNTSGTIVLWCKSTERKLQDDVWWCEDFSFFLSFSETCLSIHCEPRWRKKALYWEIVKNIGLSDEPVNVGMNHAASHSSGLINPTQLFHD